MTEYIIVKRHTGRVQIKRHPDGLVVADNVPDEYHARLFVNAAKLLASLEIFTEYSGEYDSPLALARRLSEVLIAEIKDD